MSRSGSSSVIIGISIIHLGLFCAPSLHASPPILDRPGWIRQHPYSDEIFKAVDFVDVSTGTIVGSGGVIIRTTDGGITWTRQTSATTVSLNDVDFYDSNRGAAVGDSGTVLWTENGGAVWARIETGTDQSLESVSFTSADTVQIVGGFALIRTTDGGATWNVKECDVCMISALRGASFVDGGAGIAVGDYRITVGTTDAGATWGFRYWDYSEFYTMFNDVALLSPDTAFAVGKTNDGGLFRSAIYKTNDAGENWFEVGIPFWWCGYFVSGCQLNRIAFIDADHGIAIGNNGHILRTDDRGATWAFQTSGTSLDLFGASFPDASAGWAVGAGGLILHTTDGGITWTKQTNTVTTATLKAIHFIDANRGMMAGEGASSGVTIDGGRTWWGGVGGAYMQIHDLAFNGADTGIVVGKNCCTGSVGLIRRTTDGGSTMEVVASPVSEILYGCCFASPVVAYAGGENGLLLKSIDAGVTWIELPGFPDDEWVKSVSFSDELTGTVIGGTSILRTEDGGETWTPQSSGTSEFLLDIHFTGAERGAIVGESGTILRTTDGGDTWIPQSSGTSYDLFGVHFADAERGTAVGAVGTVLHTTDGGETWEPQESGTTHTLHAVHFIDAVTGWIAGWGGIVLTTESGGYPVAALLERYAAAWEGDHVLVTWILNRDAAELEPTFEAYRSVDGGASFDALAATDIRLNGREYVLFDYSAEPGVQYIYRVVIHESGAHAVSFEVEVRTPSLSISLAQNYPNPFNPSTRIGFVLPAASRVAMAIYDSAGRCVRTVLDRDLGGGSHEVIWDGCDDGGGNVASGVYYCRLSAGKQSLSRKLVLLK